MEEVYKYREMEIYYHGAMVSLYNQEYRATLQNL